MSAATVGGTHGGGHGESDAVGQPGKIKHEMVLGMEKELKEHYEVMKRKTETEHADEYQITVQPGKSGEILWLFTTAGTVNFACPQAGHYEAGLKDVVTAAGKAMANDAHNTHRH